MDYDYNEVEQNIQVQSELTRKIVDSVLVQLLNKFDTGHLRKIRKVYMIGCGDSRFAGRAMEECFYRFSGLAARSFPSLEFSRYHVPFADSDALVIGISYSGKVVRTVEGMRLAREKGLITVGITQKERDTPLADVAEVIIALDTPSTSQIIPGCLSYYASLIGVALFAIYLGEVRACISSSRADQLYSCLKNLGKDVESISRTCTSRVEEYIAHTDFEQVWQFLGSGPNYATAEYGAVKLLEAASLNALWYDIEEWAHTGYFLVKEKTPLIIVAPEGKSYDRMNELMPAVHTLEAHALLITGEKTSPVQIPEDSIIRIHDSNLDESLTPLIYCIPLQWLAIKIAKKLQAIPFHLDNQHLLRINSQQLYKGKHLDTLDELKKIH